MKNKDIIISKLTPFIEGRAVVRVKIESSVADFLEKEKEGLIDKSGDFIIPPFYDLIKYEGGNHVAVNIGFGEVFDEHGNCIAEESGKWGIVDLNNHILIPLKYAGMWPWNNASCFSVEYENKWGAVNIFGETIIPFEYEWLSIPDEYGYITAQKDKKYGCISMSGEVLISFIYDELDMPVCREDRELIPVRCGLECFYINRSGKRMFE
jgi:hypothetical protein